MGLSEGIREFQNFSWVFRGFLKGSENIKYVPGVIRCVSEKVWADFGVLISF